MTQKEILQGIAKAMTEMEVGVFLLEPQIALYRAIIERANPVLLGYALLIVFSAGRRSAFQKTGKSASRDARIAAGDIDSIVQLSDKNL